MQISEIQILKGTVHYVFKIQDVTSSVPVKKFETETMKM